MSLNAILNTATAGLQTNQTALRVTSNNIANVNTEGYHRRRVELGPRLTGGTLTGVTIEEIQRITDVYLAREANNASSASSRANALDTYFDRVQDLVGSLDGGGSLGERISAAMTSLAQLAVDPASSPRRNSALTTITSTLNSLSDMAANVQSLRQDSNTQLKTDVARVNALIADIYQLNLRIRSAVGLGDTSTGLLDQRDNAVTELSKYMDVVTYEQSDGRIFVSTADGTGLISDLSSEIRYPAPTAVTSATSFPPMELQRTDPEGGTDMGSPIDLESHIRGGEMRGLLDMRDKYLTGLAEQLGTVGATFADQLNAVHNNSSSVPPATSLTGRNTGLFGTDALNFSGNASIALVDNTGELVQRLDLDLSTIATVDDLVSAINGGLNATATFTDGVLTITANGAGEGIAFLQDPTTPASRGGRGLSHFFGLNDLVDAPGGANFTTGVAGADASGFATGSAEFVIRAVDGSVLNTFTVSPAGGSFDDIANDLTLQSGGYATFAVNASGQLVMTPTSAGARLEVRNDTTARGATGVSLSQFFGMGTAILQDGASGRSVRSDILADSSKMALARLELTGTTAVGDVVLGIGDNRGAVALSGIATSTVSWAATGGLASGSMSVGDYVAQIMGAQADLANQAATDRVFRTDVAEEVAARRSSVEGVNIDEELAAMMVFQQAYNAAARLMTTVQQMYDTLLDVV